VTGASVVSIATLNSSGFSMTTVSPAGSLVAASSNLAVTTITGCPGDSRRLRAIEGCGGLISTLTAAAGRPFSAEPRDGNRGAARSSGWTPGPPRASGPSASASGPCRYAVETATGSPADTQTHRITRMGAPDGRRSAQATSCGASRRDTCRVWQAIEPPIGSSRVASPAAPSTKIQ
jgi:hypothetical protein